MISYLKWFKKKHNRNISINEQQIKCLSKFEINETNLGKIPLHYS